MKFGKTIQQLAQECGDFGAYFVDYKTLKKLLKPINNPALDEEAQADSEKRFQLALESELAKVESFFRSKEAEMIGDFKLLCRKVADVQQKPVTSEEFSSFEDLQELLQGTSEAELIKELLEFSSEVDRLRKFVMTNAKATVKITKKHDKNSRKIVLREAYVKVLSRCTFFNSREFGALIADIEVLALQLIEKLTGKKPDPDDFSCPICMHVLRNPLVLSCGHRFCNSCISVAFYFKAHTCPVCRKECILNDQNFRVATLLDRFLKNHFVEFPKPETNKDKNEAPCTQCKEHGQDKLSVKTCVLHKPCNACLDMSCVMHGRMGHRKASQEGLVHLAPPSPCLTSGGDSPHQSCADSPAQLERSSSSNRPWLACSEIFRASSRSRMSPDFRDSQSLLKAALQHQDSLKGSLVRRTGSFVRTPSFSDSKPKTWTRFVVELAMTVLLVIAMVACTLNSLHGDEAEVQNGTCKMNGAGPNSCKKVDTPIEKLQEARTKSLHRALDKMVSRSSKK